MNQSNMLKGSALIIIGMALLGNNIGIVGIDIFAHWPLALLLPGLIMEYTYFTTGKDPKSLISAGILITYGAVFYVEGFMPNVSSLWPMFIIGPALGQLQYYVFADRNPKALKDAALLGFIGLAFMAIDYISFDIIIPLVLMVVGLRLFAKNSTEKEIV